MAFFVTRISNWLELKSVGFCPINHTTKREYTIATYAHAHAYAYVYSQNGRAIHQNKDFDALTGQLSCILSWLANIMENKLENFPHGRFYAHSQ